MRDDTNQWAAESLRLTTFHRVGSIDLQSPDWWQRVRSSQPEQQISRPGEGLVQQSGGFSDQQLLVNARPDRIDWIFHPAPNASTGPMGAVPILGPMLQAIDAFQAVNEKWLERCEPPTRLAFGAVLLQSVNDLNSAFAKLGPFLPSVDLRGVTTPDFLYQINRPSTSSFVEGLMINKLNKWSVAQSGNIAIKLGSGGIADFSVATLGIACRLELDINTAPENTVPFAPTVASRLFNELKDFALDIAARGDTR